MTSPERTEYRSAPKAQGALAAQDYEQLVIDVVDMVRERLLARRHHRQAAAKLCCAEGSGYRCNASLKSVSGFCGVWGISSMSLTLTKGARVIFEVLSK